MACAALCLGEMALMASHGAQWENELDLLVSLSAPPWGSSLSALF